MNYLIYDQNGKKQALLQNVTSIQWKPRYWESGSAEIHARPTDENIKYLTEQNRIVCQERGEILFIDYVQRTDQNSDGADMVIHGSLDNLGDRINTSTLSITNVEEGLRKLITQNQRGLDITLAPAKGLTAKVARTKTTWQTLRSTFADLCQESGLGWRQIVKDGQLNVLEIYQGKEAKNARFSDDLGNITSQEYIKDLSDYFNYIYVLGEENGGARTQLVIDARAEGEAAIEKYVDARDLQSTYTGDDGNEHTYSTEEYMALLNARGQQKRAEMLSQAYSFEFELNEQNRIAVLGRDYDLGDIVPVISKRFGVANLARLTGLNIVEEQNTNTKITLELSVEKMEVLK